MGKGTALLRLAECRHGRQRMAENPCNRWQQYNEGACRTHASCDRVSNSEEPGAEKLHAGICAGGARQRASLPRWRKRNVIDMHLRGMIRTGVLTATLHLVGFFGIRIMLDWWDPSHIAQVSSNWWSSTGLFWKLYLFPMNVIPVPSPWHHDRHLFYLLVLCSSITVGLLGAFAQPVRRLGNMTWRALLLNLTPVSLLGYLALQGLGIGAFGPNYRGVIWPLVFLGPIIAPLAIMALTLCRKPGILFLLWLNVLWLVSSVVMDVWLLLGALFWGDSRAVIACGLVLIGSVWLVTTCTRRVYRKLRTPNQASDATSEPAPGAASSSHQG